MLLFPVIDHFSIDNGIFDHTLTLPVPEGTVIGLGMKGIRIYGKRPFEVE